MEKQYIIYVVCICLFFWFYALVKINKTPYRSLERFENKETNKESKILLKEIEKFLHDK